MLLIAVVSTQGLIEGLPFRWSSQSYSQQPGTEVSLVSWAVQIAYMQYIYTYYIYTIIYIYINYIYIYIIYMYIMFVCWSVSYPQMHCIGLGQADVQVFCCTRFTVGAAARVGDGQATAAQLLYIMCYSYYESFPHCLQDIM